MYTPDNYEAYVLDYLEDRMPKKDKEHFELFLSAYPHIADEITGLLEIRFTPDALGDIQMPTKSKRKLRRKKRLPFIILSALLISGILGVISYQTDNLLSSDASHETTNTIEPIDQIYTQESTQENSDKSTADIPLNQLKTHSTTPQESTSSIDQQAQQSNTETIRKTKKQQAEVSVVRPKLAKSKSQDSPRTSMVDHSSLNSNQTAAVTEYTTNGGEQNDHLHDSTMTSTPKVESHDKHDLIPNTEDILKPSEQVRPIATIDALPSSQVRVPKLVTPSTLHTPLSTAIMSTIAEDNKKNKTGAFFKKIIPRGFDEVLASNDVMEAFIPEVAHK